MIQEEKDILIHKWLSGQLSPKETGAFERRRIEDSSFNQDVDILKKVWNTSKSYNPKTNFDIERSWHKINSSNTSKDVIRPANKWLVPLQIAASLVFIAIIGLFLWTSNLSPSNYVEVVSEKPNEYILLPDGSEVWLNEYSTLQYPKKFDSSKRGVKLTGEAFFDVSKNDIPFVVETPISKVKVLGTSFEVNAQNERTDVIVRTGKVELISNQSDKKITLQRLDHGQQTARILQKVKLHSLNNLFWHTQELTFSDTELKSVASQISEYFKVDVQVESEEMESCTFTSALAQNNLDAIIEILAKTFDFNVEKTTNQILLKSGNCR